PQVNNGFTAWLLKRYAGLVNLPPTPPVMLHHIPRFLARQMAENPNTKIAMLVLDGLSLDQWLAIHEVLVLRQPSLLFREQTVFAWVPSLTSVSRQAAFAGRPPLFFPNSIHTTEKEPVLWTQFWVDQGFTPHEVVYLKGMGDGSLDGVSEALAHPKARIAGLVVDKIDRIMHGMELGAAGMHNQVRQWAAQPYLSALFDLLLNLGFNVYLTSDHGNVEAEGCGRPAEGAVADLRGERARVYPNADLRARVKAKFPAALEWNPIGLPDDYLALLAPPGQAFIQEHLRTVSHGGISIEELIVPLVRVERRGA
ncbi:MAG: BREX-3 system phosphatase PglZ, partial [Pseudorhodobacter sp.]|nr:BREX-3 system phosphatase PglZ [Pseudorhodobacter sp.]